MKFKVILPTTCCILLSLCNTAKADEVIKAEAGYMRFEKSRYYPSSISFKYYVKLNVTSTMLGLITSIGEISAEVYESGGLSSRDASDVINSSTYNIADDKKSVDVSISYNVRSYLPLGAVEIVHPKSGVLYRRIYSNGSTAGGDDN